jgi:DeoR family fructose operon transcriptional repressor
MNFQKRKNIILSILEERGEVTVKELADELAISEITIRRDLTGLTADGLVYRTHGGIMKVELTKTPFHFAHKTAVNYEEKDNICRLAAREIQENDIIFMDCGSTVFRLCPFIKNKKIHVITNSLPVVYELMHSMVKINLVGGEIDQERQAVHGRIAEEHIGRYKANRAFVGVDGISVENGLSAFSEVEAGITLAMFTHAEISYLLCDASKAGKDKYFQFAPLSAVDVMITNKSTAETERIQKAGIKVIAFDQV